MAWPVKITRRISEPFDLTPLPTEMGSPRKRASTSGWEANPAHSTKGTVNIIIQDGPLCGQSPEIAYIPETRSGRPTLTMKSMSTEYSRARVEFDALSEQEIPSAAVKTPKAVIFMIPIRPPRG